MPRATPCRSALAVLAALLIAFSLAGPLAAEGAAGAVYVATNDAAGNAVLVFTRFADGELDPVPQTVPTGGLGTGAGLGNQGGVVLSGNQRFLYVVNAGSDDLSVFRVLPGGLELIAVTPSGGQRPISVTRHRRLLYVLNAGGLVGGSDSISGFRVLSDGSLEAIAGSTQPLSADSTDPAQIGFARRGAALVVTEKATNLLTTYLVDAEGVAGTPLPQPSIGPTPFGFAVDKAELFVSEAFGGAPDASAVTAYELGADGVLEVLHPSAPTTETAACWVALSNDHRFAYVTNTGSASVSGFDIAHDGTLTLLDEDGVTGMTGPGPIDMDFSTDGRNLYTLNAVDGSLSAFRRSGGQGEIVPLPGVAGLPLSSNGLAAH